MNYALATNGLYARRLEDGNISFSPDVFQPASTLTAEQKTAWWILPSRCRHRLTC